MHVRVGLQHFIFLSSGEIAREFLDKRYPAVVDWLIARLEGS